MVIRFLSRTRSFRSPVGADSTKNNEVVTSPIFMDTDAQPRDDLYSLQPNLDPPDGYSSSRPRTASSPEWHQSQLKPNAPIQTYQHSSWDFEFSPLSNSHTVECPTSAEDMYIGMALGSPSQAPRTHAQSPLPPLPSETDENNTRSFIGSAPSALVPEINDVPKTGDLSKQKTKWKMFGGIFGKKTTTTPASPASPFHHVQNVPVGRLQSDSGLSHVKRSIDQEFVRTQDLPSPNRRLGKGRDGMKNRHIQKHRPENLNIKPDLSRASTAPILHVDERSPTPPPKDSTGNGSKFSRAHGEPMMLQVEIPDVAMDRFSVMFGSVLKPRQPSLLIRRQVHLENVKTVDDEEPSVSWLFVDYLPHS